MILNLYSQKIFIDSSNKILLYFFPPILSYKELIQKGINGVIFKTNYPSLHYARKI